MFAYENKVEIDWYPVESISALNRNQNLKIKIENVTTVNAGIILLILRIQNLFSENVPFSFSSIIIEVIKKPEITKKTSTPVNPPWRFSGDTWKITTAITAKALSPSISGLYFILLMLPEFCV